MKDKNKAEEVRENYVQEFMDFNHPANNYINGVLSVRTVKDTQDVHKLQLKTTDSLDDYCFLVCLAGPLPNDLRLPDLYQGVRVLYEDLGEKFKPYKS